MPERATTARPPANPSRSPHFSTGPGATLLGFDFGARRIGVAVGETATASAHPLAVLTGDAAARFAEIARLIAEWRPARLVVGVPGGGAGAATPLAARAERFARQLEGRFGLPVARVDEAYTSVEAESRVREAAGARRAARASRRRELDALAAQLILEQFLAGEREGG